MKSCNLIKPDLHLIAWEITGRCNLCCAHCRGSASNKIYADELSTEECCHLIDQILEVAKPVLIFTGGEPLVREDIFDVAQYAVNKGLRVVMGTNGTLLTRQMAARLKRIPVARLGISLDFPQPELQDNFRGQSGAFHACLEGIDNALQTGIEIQINSTITKLNLPYLNDLLTLALDMGAVAFHPFLLVSTGRGKNLRSVELSPQEYEETLNWIYEKQMQLKDKIFFKPTDAPHYLRIVSQRRGYQSIGAVLPKKRLPDSISRGCLAGSGFCFISYNGKIKGCGYLDVEAGDIRKQTFAQVWFNSPLFLCLRDLSNIKGKCGRCEYKKICGGCRARAYEATGDYLEAEPYCIYEPPKISVELKSNA